MNLSFGLKLTTECRWQSALSSVSACMCWSRSNCQGSVSAVSDLAGGASKAPTVMIASPRLMSVKMLAKHLRKHPATTAVCSAVAIRVRDMIT